MKLSSFIFFSCILVAFLMGNVWSINIVQSVKITILDIVVAVGLIRGIGQMNKSFWLFVLCAGISLLLSLRLFPTWQVGIGGLYLLRFIAYSVFFASNVWSLKLDQTTALIHGLGLGLIITGLGQYIFYPDIRSLSYLQWDVHYYRVVGTFLDPGFTALLMVLYLLFLILNPVKNKGLHWVLLVSSYLTIALTYSRSGYLAWIIGAAFVAWKVKGWKFLVAVLLLLTVTIAVLPRSPDGEGVKLERTNSIIARLHSWRNALVIWKHHPILGVGFNTYRYAQNKYGLLNDPNWQINHGGAGSDSSLLFVAATTGLVGLMLYLWYLKWHFDLRSLELSTMLVAILVHSWFLNSLFYPSVLLWLGILTARARLTALKSH